MARRGRLVDPREHRMDGEVRVLPSSPESVHLPASLAAAQEQDFVRIGVFKRLSTTKWSGSLGIRSILDPRDWARLVEMREANQNRPRPVWVSAQMDQLLDIIGHLEQGEV